MPIVACDDDNGLSEYSYKPPALAVGYMTRDKNGVTDLTEVETMGDALRRATHDLYLDVTDVMNVLPEPPVLTEVDDPLVAARAWLGWRAVCVQQIDEIVARKRLRRTSTAPAAP